MITHREAVKINAVAAVLGHWRIALSEAAAFGDDVNDIEMLRQCGGGSKRGGGRDMRKL